LLPQSRSIHALLHHGRLAGGRLHGLDVLALYIAFKINFRSADAYETVEVTALELVLAKVTARGQREVWRFNPAWVRLEQDIDDEFGTERVALVSRGQSIEVGAFSRPRAKGRARARPWSARWPTPAAARALNRITGRAFSASSAS